MVKKALFLILFGLFLLPLSAGSQDFPGMPFINTDITTIGQQLANAVWIIFTIIAVIAFVVAGILFVTSAGSPEKVATARLAFCGGLPVSWLLFSLS